MTEQPRLIVAPVRTAVHVVNEHREALALMRFIRPSFVPVSVIAIV